MSFRILSGRGFTRIEADGNLAFNLAAARAAASPVKRLVASLVSLLTLAMVSLWFVGSASAHASLVKANPAPNAVLATAPAQVQLWFDEEVEPLFSELQVLDAAQARVDTGQLTAASDDPKSLVIPLKPLGNGTYSVVWKALSATDGHVTRGVYAFSVGQASAGATAPGPAEIGPGELSPVSAGVRWLTLFALLALAGGLFFDPWLLGPSLELTGIGAGGTGTTDHIAARWLRLTGILLLLALITGLAELFLQAGLVADAISIDTLGRVLLATRYGTLWLARVALLLLVGLGLAWRLRSRQPGTISRYALPLVVAGALLTRALGSHGAAAGGDLSLGALSDWLHLAGVAVWVGGLVYFALLMPLVWRLLEPGTRGRWLARLITRFSTVVIFATFVIAVTGLYNSTLELPSLPSAWQTLYGNTLLLKVALFGVMLLFGAFNLLFIGPRMRRSQGAPASGAHLYGRFRVTLTLEVLLGSAAILLAALLTLQPPARAQLAPGPAVAQNVHVYLAGDAAPDARVQLTIGPDVNAPAQFDARVIDAQGQPTTNILRVIFNFTLLDSDTGTQTVNAEPGTDGHYMAMGNYIALDGMWRIRVTVRRKGLEDVLVEFPFYRASGGNPLADEEARALLAQSDARMNTLTSLRSTQYLNDGANGVVVTDSEFRAPDRMRYTLRGQGTSIAVGPMQYFQENGAWTERGRVRPYLFPNFDLSKQALWTSKGRSENAANGEPAQIVRFAIPSSSGHAGIQYAYWISTRDHRLLQYAMVADAHYMFEYYRDYDGSGIDIQPPVVASAPAATATPNPANATAPLTAARRPRGFITGDLGGDGGLILLVTGITTGVLALGRRLTNTAKLVAFGIAAGCILAGFGLFVDALNATAAANQSVTVNPQMATEGRTTYQEYCASCHGAGGKGDGPAGSALPVKPLDLTTHVLLHDEFYLHDVILNGRGSMPAFGSTLSQDQILQVVAYIRQLAIDARQNNPAPGFTPQP